MTSNAPPSQVWLSHNPGQHLMPRTSQSDPQAVRYVLGADYDGLLEYVERMTSKNAADPVSVINELRFALGDNGSRSIPELIEFARDLAASAALSQGDPDASNPTAHG